MSVRDVCFNLMALGQMAGCRGKQYTAPEIMAEAVSEIIYLTEERDALAKAIGEAVVALGVARPVPMTGPELIHMLESYVRHEVAQRATPCEP